MQWKAPLLSHWHQISSPMGRFLSLFRSAVWSFVIHRFVTYTRRKRPVPAKIHTILKQKCRWVQIEEARRNPIPSVRAHTFFAVYWKVPASTEKKSIRTLSAHSSSHCIFLNRCARLIHISPSLLLPYLGSVSFFGVPSVYWLELLPSFPSSPSRASTFVGIFF